MMKVTKIGLIGLALLLMVMMVVGCAQSADAEKTKKDSYGTNGSADKNDSSTANKPNGSHSDNNPVVTLELESGAKIEIELYRDVAPNTVKNFVSLVKSGFYDGLIFHRIMSGFMVQGGDPEGTGMGGPGYSIKGEFASNGFKNDLKHEVGVISMARSGHPDSAGSQFFIMHGAATYLDGDYAAFGKVIAGLEHVDDLGNVATGQNDRPVENQVIKKMTVDTKGVELGEPVKVNQ